MTIPGDSLKVRSVLVFGTFLVAVMIPNVQALISLVGALAGSSTALLIPPMLELAWIEDKKGDPIFATTASMMFVHGDEQKCFGRLMPAYWFDTTKCYILLMMGFLFFSIGTYSSLVDIVRIYESGQ
jgi:proton-coupled amino acid transporter